MGGTIEKEFFEPNDYEVYRDICHKQLAQLKTVLSSPGFSSGQQMFGAEVEYSLIDAKGKPCPVNQNVIQSLGDSDCQTELNQYNLEYNFAPSPIQGSPFSLLESRLENAYGTLNSAAQNFNASVIMIGILPTIGKHDVGEDSMTPEPRYRAISRGIKRLRQGSFNIDIDGQEPLQIEMDDLTLEGANTSIQLHLQVKPDEFVDWYNAIQLATPIAVAICGNSPIFLGHQLWEETRIAVFKQALESRRDKENIYWRQPHRVSFGYGWLRQSAWEYFAEIESMYHPLLPLLNPNPKDGGVPDLYELRLHQGTVWRWNRGIYDPTDKGHIRIEMRALPSGPSIKDMVAGGAFLMGVASGLKEQMNKLLPAFPFMFCEYNFYRAAQKGFDSKLLWPSLTDHSPKEYLASDLAKDLLPLAQEGLEALGVAQLEAQAWLEIVKERLIHKRSGAIWLREHLNKMDNGDREKALELVTLKYLENMQTNKPVIRW